MFSLIQISKKGIKITNEIITKLISIDLFYFVSLVNFFTKSVVLIVWFIDIIYSSID